MHPLAMHPQDRIRRAAMQAEISLYKRRAAPRLTAEAVPALVAAYLAEIQDLTDAGTSLNTAERMASEWAVEMLTEARA